MANRVDVDAHARHLSLLLIDRQVTEAHVRHDLARLAHATGAADTLAQDAAYCAAEAEEVAAMAREVVTRTILLHHAFFPGRFAACSFWSWCWSFTRTVVTKQAATYRAAATWSRTTVLPDHQLDTGAAGAPDGLETATVSLLESAAAAARVGRRPPAHVAAALARTLCVGFGLPHVGRLAPSQRIVARALLDDEPALAEASLRSLADGRRCSAPLGLVWVGWQPDDADHALALAAPVATLLADAATLPPPHLSAKRHRSFVRTIVKASRHDAWHEVAEAVAHAWTAAHAPRDRPGLLAAYRRATEVLAALADAAAFPGHPLGRTVGAVETWVGAAFAAASAPHEDFGHLARNALPITGGGR